MNDAVDAREAEAPVEVGAGRATAPCPPQVRAMGVLALAMGVTLPAVAVLAMHRFPDEAVLGPLGVAIAALGGLLLVLGGCAFLARARWGRVPLWLYAWGAWPAGTMLVVAAAERVAAHGAPRALFTLAAGATLGAGLFALLLGGGLLFGRVAAWTDGAPAPRREGPSTQSTQALLSLIFAFVPPWGVMHAVSLLLGIRAIGRIRRARGALHGRGMALAGVFVSAGLFVLVCAGFVAASHFKAGGGAAGVHEARMRLRELALLQRLHGELDWDGDGRDNPCTTTLTALLDAGAKDRAAGPIDAALAEALRAADEGVRGAKATPLDGYVYRLETPPADDEGARPWRIRAYARSDGRAPTLEVDDQSEPKRAEPTPGE